MKTVEQNVYLPKRYTAQNLLKEFPNKSWNERSFRLSPVQLTGVGRP